MSFNPFENFIFFDSCAFDGGDASQQEASRKAREILGSKGKKIILMHSVVSEIRHQKTPVWLQEIESRSRKTAKLNLTELEKATLKRIEDIIVGNGSLDKRKADCFHVFEAQKYGGCFVTSDWGIYKHAQSIKNQYGLHIVTPIEFLKLIIECGDKT